MQGKLKNAKGITLVALIITIIILLILAGVTIGLVIGENGLIEKSKQSVNKYNDASEIERINMIVAEAQTKGYEQGNNGELTQANLQEALDNSYGVGKATASEKQADGSFIIKVGEKEYKIDDSLEVSENKPIEKVQPKNIADWEYTTDTETNTITINKYKGTDTEVVVPNYIGDIPVKAIDGNGESIWDESICETVSLSSGTAKAQLTIEKITIPDGIEAIEWKNFADTRNLKNISLPNTLKYIGGYAFYRCYNLGEIIIPKSICSIGHMAFAECTSLKNAIILNGVIMADISSRVFAECTSLANVTIPNGVIIIGNETFYNCKNLESITMPDSVTNIGSGVFGGCSKLTRVKLSQNITCIEGGMFSVCSSLKTIEIPENVTSIDISAFSDCSSLESIEVDENNKDYSSKEGVLYNKDKTQFIFCPENKTNIEIPDSVIEIGKNIFIDCKSLESIEVDENNKNYSSKEGVLYNKDKTQLIRCPAQKKNVEISNGVIDIENCAFNGCSSITNIEMPNSVNYIGWGTFAYCTSLISIKIPDSVTVIDNYAFSECSSLATVEIPNSVTSIGNYAFSIISPDAQITCDFASKPSGWDSSWTNCKNIIWKRAQTNQT